MTIPAGPKIGILGGTFDPIHFGHLRAASRVVEIFGLERFLFVPAARPPHKGFGPFAPFEHRLAMVRLAVDNLPKLEVDDLEGRRPGKSYTVDTLTEFGRRYGPAGELYFVTGLDAFLDIGAWREYLRLFDLARFVVIDRPGRGEPDVLGPFIAATVSPDYVWDPVHEAWRHPDKQPIHYRSLPPVDVSSTEIRRRLFEGRTVHGLIPEAVHGYILANGLYMTARTE